MSRVYLDFNTHLWWFQDDDVIYWCVGEKQGLEKLYQEKIVEKRPYQPKDRFKFDDIFSESGFKTAKREYSHCPSNLVAYCQEDGSVYVFSVEYELQKT